ncbi:MAG: hypothetical protein D6733_01745 [Methanobacteriota archaeon]|nr:MAG: hypothetical protein D6733_01745 [Euryarchaeota archaeon]
MEKKTCAKRKPDFSDAEISNIYFSGRAFAAYKRKRRMTEKGGSLDTDYAAPKRNPISASLKSSLRFLARVFGLACGFVKPRFIFQIKQRYMDGW